MAACVVEAALKQVGVTQHLVVSRSYHDGSLWAGPILESGRGDVVLDFINPTRTEVSGRVGIDRDWLVDTSGWLDRYRKLAIVTLTCLGHAVMLLVSITSIENSDRSLLVRCRPVELSHRGALMFTGGCRGRVVGLAGGLPASLQAGLVELTQPVHSLAEATIQLAHVISLRFASLFYPTLADVVHFAGSLGADGKDLMNSCDLPNINHLAEGAGADWDLAEEVVLEVWTRYLTSEAPSGLKGWPYILASAMHPRIKDLVRKLIVDRSTDLGGSVEELNAELDGDFGIVVNSTIAQPPRGLCCPQARSFSLCQMPLDASPVWLDRASKLDGPYLAKLVLTAPSAHQPHLLANLLVLEKSNFVFPLVPRPAPFVSRYLGFFSLATFNEVLDERLGDYLLVIARRVDGLEAAFLSENADTSLLEGRRGNSPPSRGLVAVDLSAE